MKSLILSKKIAIESPDPYSSLPPRKAQKDFELQDMALIYEQSQGTTDRAHRHDYFTILLVEEAIGEHLIDFQTYAFQPKQVHFVSPGQIHRVHTSQQPKGWVITFSNNFLLQNHIPDSFIYNINLFRQFGESPPLVLDEISFERLQGILDQMRQNLKTEVNYQQRALGALLQLFLIYCNNSCNLDVRQLDREDKGICILRDFKQLVNSNYQEWHQVNHYASALHISPKHLSQSVKDITGLTAKAFIQERIILEAKRLLLHTPKSIKEIAYELGFEEPLHFSGFFKKCVTQSPSDFRGKS